MAEKLLGPTGSRRRFAVGRWGAVATPLAALIIALALTLSAYGAKPGPLPPAGPYQVPTGPIGVASGFADNDGNTTQPNSSTDYSPAAATDPRAATQPTFDWNSIATNPSYSDTTDDPYGAASGTTSGWEWTALNDAAVSNSDTSFAGGVKQDDDCAVIDGSKAPNKDDLKRAYIAAKTVNNHTYLNLAWVRIPQNTTSSSAHIGFEFNQSGNSCGGAGKLVHRQAGDLLLVYDFTGGSAVPPTINLSRWVTSGSCQVGSDSPPCWGTFTALDATEAEANVDTSLSHICSSSTAGSCGPGETDSSDGTSTKGTKYEVPFQTSDNLAPTTETLGTSEFGEAGIDLTAAGVFGAGACVSFGDVFAVSRSSGDSNTAAMEDLVGPGSFELSNCTASTATSMEKSSNNTTFTSLANSGSIAAGSFVRDNATETVGGTNSWSGTVDFYLCKSTTTQITSCSSSDSGASHITGTGGGGSDYSIDNTDTTATSGSTQVNDAGYYCWAAYFTHSTPTGLPDSESTTGECFTVTTTTAVATNPWIYPQDRAVISASTGGALAGSVQFELYDTLADCNADGGTAATGLKYDSGAVGVSGSSPQTKDTANNTFRVTASTAANMYWRVTYTSTNSLQGGTSSACVENMGVTITADGTVSFS